MAYRLGVDLGTTFTAAAVADGGRPTMIGLGNRALQIPSVLFLTPEDDLLVGEVAERRGQAQPDRLVREFKRRLGDTVPVLVGGTPWSPQSLMARLLQGVVATATERMGSAPELVVLTHPVSWGPYKLDLLTDVARLADVGSVLLRPEPVAAAAQFAARTPLEAGSVVAVYDFGGGTFDACVLRKTSTGFELLGEPGGVEHLGGLDLDEAVLAHVLRLLGDRVGRLDRNDPATVLGLARLRRECVEAKEALSADSDTVLSVSLPTVSTTLRLTRAELETLVRPMLDQTVQVLARTLRSAAVTPEQLVAVVLIGGSSRIPLVGEVLQRAFATPVAVDTHPKHDVALGALRGLDLTATPGHLPVVQPPSEPPPPPPVVVKAPPTPVVRAPARTVVKAPPPAVVKAPPPTPGDGGTRSGGGRAAQALGRRGVLVLLALLVVGGLTAAILATRSPGSGAPAALAPASTVEPPPSSTAPPACGSAEEFDGPSLGSAWTRTRPDADVRLVDGAAEITAPDGADIFRERITAPMLLQQLTGDFTIETVVRATPRQFYQGAGLVLRSGSTGYVRLELGFLDLRGLGFEYQDVGPHVWVHSPRKGPKSVPTSAEVVVLRLERRGSTITARWRPVAEPGLRDLGSITVTFPATIGAGVSVVNRAQGQARPEDFEARFDRVDVTC